MMQLETNRLLIRPFVMADLEAVHQVLDHDLLWAGPGITVEQRRERLQREINLAQWADTGNLFSTDAAHAHSWNVSYAASKHAIESYSRSAAAELGRYGITVNIVAPGPIQTGYIIPEAKQQIRAGTPLGDVGKPEHIADVVVFLASEQAHWLTGQLLYVGGGWRMGQ
jgi:3-oxoacyl-[acyl-carrier protein] reductase